MVLSAALFIALQSERVEVDRWFDALPEAAALNQPFGRLVNSGVTIVDGSSPDNYSVGFLLKSQSRVVGLDLADLYWDFKPIWRPYDLKTWATNRLAETKKKYSGERDFAIRDFGRLYVISRACAARGLGNLSNEFYRIARSSVGYPDQKLPFLTALQKDLSRAVFGRVMSDLGDSKPPRSALPAEFERAAHDFPLSEHASFAHEMAGRLTAMLPDDAAHGPFDERRLAAMSINDQVEELVFRLRDFHAVQVMHPGDVMVFMPGTIDVGDPEGEKTIPMRLVKIGLAAVPQLIEAMTDTTPTRSTRDPHKMPQGEVFTVGDAALQIVQRISCLSFDPAGLPADRPSQNRAFQKQARAWWSEIQARGEERVLTEAVMSGHGGADQMERLAMFYPESATSVFRKAIVNTRLPEDRAKLVGTLALVIRPEARALAREQMLCGADLDTRVEAARVVARTNPDAAVKAMIALWRTSHAQDQGSLVGFLYASERSGAVDALAQTIGRRPWSDRSAIFSNSMNDFPSEMLPKRTPAERNAYNRSVERLLAMELTDLEPEPESNSNGDELSADQETLADLAADSLKSNFPWRYSFKKTGSEIEKQRIRAQSLSVWRRSQNLPPIPVPSHPALPIPLAKLLTQLRRTPKNAADRPQLESRARAISLRVRSTKTEGPLRFGSLARSLDRLRGRPLTSDGLSDLIRSTFRTCRGMPTKSLLALIATWMGKASWFRREHGGLRSVGRGTTGRSIQISGSALKRSTQGGSTQATRQVLTRSTKDGKTIVTSPWPPTLWSLFTWNSGFESRELSLFRQTRHRKRVPHRVALR